MTDTPADELSKKALFEPPKYLASLIGSINDGAKTAQTSALFLAFVGLYLAATAISVTDEDLFRGAAIQLSQLGGVSVPVIVSFLLGPIVFFVLHAQLLIRYGMLVRGLRLFRRELKTIPDGPDRNRCRELLANVEFVMMFAGRADPPMSTRLYGLAVFLSIAVIPVVVLLAVQISFLRYQSDAITWTQRIALAADLVMLVVFYYWLWRIEWQDGRGRRSASLLRVALYALVPLAVAIVNLVYFGVPDADAITVRYWDLSEKQQAKSLAARLVSQPLDLVLCPEAGWGCRYLQLNNRRLIGTATTDAAIQQLRTGTGSITAALAAIEGLSLRGRTLRFANFNASQAYEIDLVGNDLRRATFWNTSLHGAKLSSAQLQGADFEIAQLQGADFNWAYLAGANFTGAHLQGADMMWADMRGADLRQAQLQGANLRGASLQGADLQSANLNYADLREVRFWQTALNDETSFDFADMRDIDPTTPMLDEDRGALMSFLKKGPDAKRRSDALEQRLEQAPAPASAQTVGRKVLVSPADSQLPFFSYLAAEDKLIVDRGKEGHAAYAAALGDMPMTAAWIATGMARRAIAGAASARQEDKAAYMPLICLLLSEMPPKGSLHLPDDQVRQLTLIGRLCAKMAATPAR